MSMTKGEKIDFVNYLEVYQFFSNLPVTLFRHPPTSNGKPRVKKTLVTEFQLCIRNWNLMSVNYDFHYSNLLKTESLEAIVHIYQSK